MLLREAKMGWNEDLPALAGGFQSLPTSNHAKSSNK